MLAVKYYDFRISSNEIVIVSGRTNDTTISFEHSDNNSRIVFIVNVTVVDIKGQRSVSTIAEKIIGMQNMIVT